MAESVQSSQAADATPRERLAKLSSKLGADLTRVNSYITALRLAACGDETAGGHQLYWPDLIEMLQGLLPDPVAIENEIANVCRQLPQEPTPKRLFGG